MRGCAALSAQDDALDGLVYARALLVMGVAGLRVAVDAAVDGLVAGLDNEPLRELAGLPAATGSSELEDLLDQTITTFDPAYPTMSDSDAVTLVARRYALRYLDGSLTARQLSSWAHSTIGHEGADEAQPLVRLDDELDMRDSGVARQPIDSDAIIRQFLESTVSVPDRLRLRPGR